MGELQVRSPAAKLGGIVYVGRMLDKIRLHARGGLPTEYQANLGRGFDGSCVAFLRIDYNQLVARVSQGGSDDDILQWLFEHGRKPDGNEIHVWNEYMRKRGWNDEISETLARRNGESGMADRAEIQTMFDYIDADEGRPLTPFQS